MNKDGLTLFISSHLMSEIEEYCDTVFVINGGRLVASGTVREILKPHEQVLRVVFGGPVPGIEKLTEWKEIRKAEKLTEDSVEITLAAADSAWLNQWLLAAGHRVSALALIPSSGGQFEVTVDGDLIFSKAELGRHAEPGEIAALLRDRLGPEVARE